MHNNPILLVFVFVMLGLLITTIVLKKFKQPHVIAYLLTGVLLGPFGLNVVHDHESLSRMGDLGIILLLFFAGMEVSPSKLASSWVVPIIGTLIQISATILIVTCIGYYGFHWPLDKVLVFGGVVALSSTAVIVKMLQDSGDIKTRLGQNILGVLLVQDLAIVPMLIGVGFLGGNKPGVAEILTQVIGGSFVILIATLMILKKGINIPFLASIAKDQEMRVFAALVICFGMAAITGALGLSSALGAFIGGIIVSSTKETEWVGNSLLSVKTIFTALFFISIGMLIDLNLLIHNLKVFVFLLLMTYVLNTVICTLVFRSLKQSWSESIHAGAMLSQIGEFSFLLITMAFSLHIVSDNTFQFCLTLISMSILFSPLWISILKWQINSAKHRAVKKNIRDLNNG